MSLQFSITAMFIFAINKIDLAQRVEEIKLWAWGELKENIFKKRHRLMNK